MSEKHPKPPSDLGVAGRRLWREIGKDLEERELLADRRELLLLHEAAREADTLARIEADLRDAPLTVRGAQGQPTSNALIGEARRSRQLVSTLLKQIVYSDTTGAKPEANESNWARWAADHPHAASKGRAGALKRHYGDSSGMGSTR